MLRVEAKKIKSAKTNSSIGDVSFKKINFNNELNDFFYLILR
jgi:hypothetical protein